MKGYAMAYNWKGELRTVGWATVYAGAAPDDGILGSDLSNKRRPCDGFYAGNENLI